NTSVVCVSEQLRKFHLWFGQRQRVAQIDFVNALRRRLIRTVDLNLAIDSAGPQDCWIDQIRAIGGKNDNHILQWLQAVHLGAKHWHQRAEDAVITSGPPGSEN